MTIEWEKVDSIMGPSTLRLPVPGGWLYVVITDRGMAWREEPAVSAPVFVADPKSTDAVWTRIADKAPPLHTWLLVGWELGHCERAMQRAVGAWCGSNLRAFDDQPLYWTPLPGTP